jgi:hypothetical protein
MRRILSSVFTVAMLAVFLFLLFVALSRGQEPEIIAGGGTFVLEKAAVAGGGGEKQMLTLIENGTAGQSIAGVKSSGGSYLLYGGFWTPDDFAPTAAGVTVGGRITSPASGGVKGILVTLTSPSGSVRSTISSSFGYYSFSDVMVGETCMITVYSKKYSFSESTRVLNVADELTDVDFIALPLE